ncbi:PAP2-domain-containing protein [Podospora didyma]|uniref:PAP2-domain-containing protein n=1 Tax=Podospora didyma TaxID=330526 RepID=A0AAE0P738_9PEZI|nr:PAP2-domain-containing protein [Podospora didyma]
MPDDSIFPLIPRLSAHSNTSRDFPYPNHKMAMADLRHAGGAGARKVKRGWVVVASYCFDWIILIIAAAVGYVLGDVTPNKRPFSLADPNISFPFTEKETVPLWLLVVCSDIVPIVIVAIISLIFVPGATVPRGTPRSLVWKRKLWELHTGWLGLALSIVSAWLITNGMKNLFGKPRPDLLDRCQPDFEHVLKYVVGGTANASYNGQLVSAGICTNTDKSKLDDGFRSYPSGHSSNSAAGLIYLSLFIASKFAITIPFLAPAGYATENAFSAFPSRMRVNNGHGDASNPGSESYELRSRGLHHDNHNSSPTDPLAQKNFEQRTRTIAAVRLQAAAPPLYLLAIAIIPFFASVFIASSRWFDFRHHGFDILFGFLIGLICAFFSFRYYHLPISSGAGWAWGPRSHDKAFWAGVGSFSYATPRVHSEYRSGDEEEAIEVAPPNGYAPQSHGTGLSSHSGRSAAPASVSARKLPPQEYEAQDRESAYMGATAI